MEWQVTISHVWISNIDQGTRRKNTNGCGDEFFAAGPGYGRTVHSVQQEAIDIKPSQPSPPLTPTALVGFVS